MEGKGRAEARSPPTVLTGEPWHSSTPGPPTPDSNSSGPKAHWGSGLAGTSQCPHKGGFSPK